MKKLFAVVSLTVGLTACVNDGVKTEQRLDSLEQKIDTTLDKASDSLEARAKVIRDKIKRGLRSIEDSINKKDSINQQ
jgi:hypothetical protein